MYSCQKKNIKSIILSETQEFSAKSFCDRYFISDFNNLNDLDKFIDSADYFTIETENVPISIIHYIEKIKAII